MGNVRRIVKKFPIHDYNARWSCIRKNKKTATVPRVTENVSAESDLNARNGSLPTITEKRDIN